MFTASVNGTPPISLQWRHNGSNIPNATANSLILAGLQTDADGQLHLVRLQFLRHHKQFAGHANGFAIAQFFRG